MEFATLVFILPLICLLHLWFWATVLEESCIISPVLTLCVLFLEEFNRTQQKGWHEILRSTDVEHLLEYFKKSFKLQLYWKFHHRIKFSEVALRGIGQVMDTVKHQQHKVQLVNSFKTSPRLPILLCCAYAAGFFNSSICPFHVSFRYEQK